MGRTNYLGLVGNGHTVALISPDLTVQWFCPGRFDNFPLFAGALDPSNGGGLRVTVQVDDEPLTPLNQNYLEDTNLLCTELGSELCHCLVTDFMPWERPALIRIVELTNKEPRKLSVRITTQLEPLRTKFCTADVTGAEGILLARMQVNELVKGYQTDGQWNEVVVAVGLGLVHTASVSPQAVFSLEPGEKTRVVLGLAYGTSQDEATKALRDVTAGAVDLADSEAQKWHKWLAEGHRLRLSSTDADLVKAYRRSLLTLKLLMYEPTGAIIAAPTASLPATPGGGENWDYRYAWLRDGYYVALAMDRAGFHREARRFYDFAATLQRPDGSWQKPLYTVTGKCPREYIVPDLHGPGGEEPIRFGNKAAEQLQLDNTGNILDGIWQHYRLTQDLDYLRQWWPRVFKAAGWVTTHWQEPENGIWEFRDELVHWVHGKVMCFAALQAASAIARELQEGELAHKWELEAGKVAEDVTVNGYSRVRGLYLQHYGETASLDISVLALTFYGLLPANDPRLIATVTEMEKEITAGGLRIGDGLARYDFARVPFYLPTFWLARYYLQAGKQGRARELIRTCLDNATSLLLMAEHFDSFTHTQWGNFPQAFSHEELVQVLLQLESTGY